MVSEGEEERGSNDGGRGVGRCGSAGAAACEICCCSRESHVVLGYGLYVIQPYCCLGQL